MRTKSIWIKCLYIILFVLGGCKSLEVVEFTTIADGPFSYYDQLPPALIVITNPAEIETEVKKILLDNKGVLDKLNNLNYEDVFAILVLQGQKQITNYSVNVRQVTRSDNNLIVEADFITPKPGEVFGNAFTSPFSLITIKKSGQWSENITFMLQDKGEVVAVTSHYIP